jgi:hypothetical protein
VLGSRQAGSRPVVPSTATSRESAWLGVVTALMVRAARPPVQRLFAARGGGGRYGARLWGHGEGSG